MTTDETYRTRARDAINAARRGHLIKPKFSSSIETTPISLDRNLFETAQENSIEVYDDKFGRNTILTRSARMRKFRFYQYKPINESPSTPKTNCNLNNGNDSESRDISDDSDTKLGRISSSDSHNSPLLLPREDVVQGKVTLVAEQSKELIQLDKDIAELEKKIADLNNSCNSRNVDNLDELFNLVNKKNDLLRRQMQLNIIEQEKALEKANEELTKELRSLMSINDQHKTKAQLERQQYLYDQSLALVNKRNELVHHMDVQERGIDDDNRMKETLKNVISDAGMRQRLSRGSRGSQDQNCVIQ